MSDEHPGTIEHAFVKFIRCADGWLKEIQEIDEKGYEEIYLK